GGHDLRPDPSHGRLDVDVEGDRRGPAVYRAAHAPMVEEGDVGGLGALGRAELAPDGVRDGEQGDLCDAVRYAEQGGDLGGTAEMRAGPGGTEATRPGGETEAPPGLDHRVEQARAPDLLVSAVDRAEHQGGDP